LQGRKSGAQLNAVKSHNVQTGISSSKCRERAALATLERGGKLREKKGERKKEGKEEKGKKRRKERKQKGGTKVLTGFVIVGVFPLSHP